MDSGDGAEKKEARVASITLDSPDGHDGTRIRLPWVNFSNRQKVCTLAANHALGHFALAEQTTAEITSTFELVDVTQECDQTFAQKLLWSTVVIIVDDLGLRTTPFARDFIHDVRNFRRQTPPILLQVGSLPSLWEHGGYFQNLRSSRVPDGDWRNAAISLMEQIYLAHNV